MKKVLILLLFFISMQTMAATVKINGALAPADTLEQYAGRYKLTQGANAVYLNIYVENGKLTSKQVWDGQIKPLDHLNGDNFIVSIVGWSVKFIRDKNRKVVQMQVRGHDMWTKVDEKPLSDALPANTADYLGKYQITMGGQNLEIEIALKNGKLWGTQLWDGGNSAVSNVAGDEFIVDSLGWPIKFIRDKDNKVSQLLLNKKDVFTKE